MTFRVPEHLRWIDAPNGFHSTKVDGNNGVFAWGRFRMIASDEGGWEHVSVSLADRTPTWSEMCRIKAMFWDAEDVVVQYHPAESDYVNFHPHCLHLWRPVGIEFPVPPSWMVGPRRSGMQEAM